VTRRDIGPAGFDSTADAGPAIQRLLFVADVAVAYVDELPPAVRAVIDAAADLYVVTPTLPGRLAWLADEVDRFRRVADERLDTVLSHMRAIGAHAGGDALRGNVLTVLTDGVEVFGPDHILLALNSSAHANWQEHGLVEHVAQRFGLPVTSYAVDRRGRASGSAGPLLLCYDGSPEATQAIERTGRLLAGRHALVVTVWQRTAGLAGSAWWPGANAGTVDFFEFDRAAAEAGGRVAAAGARIAREAGLEAEPLAAEADGPVWRTIVEISDRHDAAAIVMGSRGLTGVRSMLLGSVSSAVLRHADRPTLVIPPAQPDGGYSSAATRAAARVRPPPLAPPDERPAGWASPRKPIQGR
jgi:nucleotide-binding universal stress UspA family protein